MSTALFTGLSGLRSFQTYLSVIGNNISNSNTAGYRGSRVNFGDLLSQTMSAGASPNGNLGGINPQQIGLGVGIKSIDVNVNTGSLLATSRNLDLAIFGPGFFVVSDGNRNLYTRAGTFGFDSEGQLVDLGTGFKVLGPDEAGITVPPNAISPPMATTEITMQGNLPAEVGGPLPEILSTLTPFTTGTAAVVTGTNTGPFALNDLDQMSIQVDSGPPQTITFNAGDFVNINAATATEVEAAINSQLSGATVTVGGGGELILTSDTLGAQSSILVTDLSGSPAFLFGLSTLLTNGTEQNALGTTDLNDLVVNLVDYNAATNDGIEVRGTDMNGNPFSGTFVYGTDGTTLEDLRAFIDGLVPGASATLNADGTMVITANQSGEADFSITLEDAPGNTAGVSDFSQVAFIIDQEGTDPDEVVSSINVFDQNGEPHLVQLTLVRVDANTWDLVATLPDGDGFVLDGNVSDITFQNGFLVSAGGAGNGDLSIELQFQTGNQQIDLDFGTPLQTDGLTQFGGPATAQALSQDGFAFGNLTDVVVSEDGEVRGIFTNGQVIIYGEVGLGSFANPGALTREGENMWAESVNSGAALLGSGGGPGGTIQSGVLEASNVDLAEEFVHMIEAQRGYQASARIIRASEELLQSLLQNI